MLQEDLPDAGPSGDAAFEVDPNVWWLLSLFGREMFPGCNSTGKKCCKAAVIVLCASS